MINKIKLNGNHFLNLFHDELYKFDYDYDDNINQYLDDIFYMLLNPLDIIFEEIVIH